MRGFCEAIMFACISGPMRPLLARPTAAAGEAQLNLHLSNL